MTDDEPPFIDKNATGPNGSPHTTFVYTKDRVLYVRVRTHRRWWQFWKPKTRPIKTFKSP